MLQNTFKLYNIITILESCVSLFFTRIHCSDNIYCGFDKNYFKNNRLERFKIYSTELQVNWGTLYDICVYINNYYS